ncbi:hypothetical protein MERGE_001716 [Pneumocystis wakefieldiae]|uniref:Mon2/Sec7/BIG1-like HUS domain-containing protein n=1 Tax=Pneumocystis wakefieldiae TaxID=38082 RepID=A0A899FVT3_9ASCO|nr:hypothetical protein MERGE_001716 [Pneumocystis wakefieldiae]
MEQKDSCCTDVDVEEDIEDSSKLHNNMVNEHVLNGSEGTDISHYIGESTEEERAGKNDENSLNNEGDKDSDLDTIKRYEMAKESLNNVSDVSENLVRDDDKKFAENYLIKEPLKSYPNVVDSSVKMNEGLEFGSIVFVAQALENILSTKEGKRNGPLRDSIFKTLEAIRTGGSSSPSLILESLHYACKTRSPHCIIPALDCLSKLLSYSFFVDFSPTLQSSSDSEAVQEKNMPTPSIMERVINTICDCFQGDATDERVQLQIVKALLSVVLNENPKTIVHQNLLLKAVRQTYNIFLLNKNISNQIIIQGILTQMIHTIFERVKSRFIEGLKNEDNNISGVPLSESFSEKKKKSIQLDFQSINCEVQDSPLDTLNMGILDEKLSNLEIISASEKNILESFENSKSPGNAYDFDMESRKYDENQLFIRDAFILFRVLCKLSIKQLSYDNTNDLRSHSMRSKLLSLHLIYSILDNYMEIFTSQHIKIHLSSSSITFIQAVKEYLCLILTRNFVSPVQQVFNISCEIFWKMIGSLRKLLKVEIEVFLKEIFLPILEMRNSTYQQKQILLEILQRISNDPKVLVEVYLNYDCDRAALDNIYEKKV